MFCIQTDFVLLALIKIKLLWTESPPVMQWSAVLFHRYTLYFGTWYLVLRKETTIGDGQFGFMPGRGTTDAIFPLRPLMEKHREKHKGLHIWYL